MSDPIEIHFTSEKPIRLSLQFPGAYTFGFVSGLIVGGLGLLIFGMFAVVGG